MPSPLEKLVAQKKESIEALMEVFERGAEVLASAVGELFPLCEAAAPVLRLALDNVQSREVFYVKEQFQVVRNKLDVISEELEDIDQEIKRSLVDSHYFTVEENLRNQFRKYMDILNAKEQFREVKVRLFLEHYGKTSGDKNLHVLYDAVMGFNTFGESVLEVVLRYEARNRRVLEDFCVRLKELFCVGLIALLGRAALSVGEEEEQELVRQWGEKMREVEGKMKAAIDECVAAFPEQAQEDVERMIKEKEEKSNEELAKALQEFLARKYDWVKWSVRVINHSGSGFKNWRAGDNFHCVTGKNWFELLQVNDTNVVVSYSRCPHPIAKESIQQLMDRPNRKGGAQAVAEAVAQEIPGCVANAISRHKEVWTAWSFPDECHYWEKHKNVYLCVHSE
ncbi:protein rapunzel-like [Amia ocellicauda]|uniref:protein rapunzel-like n=1 Tax=Amia ocellicauda TaxID=2972642 RepID=UPI003463BE7F